MKTNKLWEKLLASIMVVMLTAGNLIVIGNSMHTYAEGNLEAQNERTSSANVEFGAYFKSEGTISHSLESDASEEQELYMHLKVKDGGYLKNGKIELVDPNYEMLEKDKKEELIDTRSTNKLALKQVNNGTDVEIVNPIKIELKNNFKVTDISKDSKVVLTGTYIGNDGREIQIRKAVELNVTWTGKSEVSGTSKIITYQKENGKTIVQEKITIENKQTSLPIEKTSIKVEAPEISGLRPEKVNVTSTKTTMTNGKELNDTKIGFAYDKETGKLLIETENKGTNGEVYLGLGKDEYVITYEYGKEIEKAEIVTNAQYKVKNYGVKAEEVEEETIGDTLAVQKTFGDYIEDEIEIKDINKAKMYANYNSDSGKYETEYEIKENLKVNRAEGIDQVQIKDEKEEFEDAEGRKYEVKDKEDNYTYYKETRINKADFKKVLGKDGQIRIETANGEEIATIKYEEKLDGKEDYIVDYAEKNGEIVIKTSKPVAEGIIKITHVKEIRADLAYKKEQVESFTGLVVKKVASAKEEKGTEGKAKLEEAVTHLNVEANKEVISKEKEEIEIKVELGNNKEDSKLYEEPTVLVILPEFVENVEITNSNLLFEDELEIKDVQVGRVGEQKAIKVDLEGTQTKFNEIKNGNGTTLMLGANLTNKEESGAGEIIARVGNTNVGTSIISLLEPKPVVPEIRIGTGDGEDEEQGNEIDDMFIQLYSRKDGGIVSEGDVIKYDANIYGEFRPKHEYEDEIIPPMSNVSVKDVLPSGTSFKSGTIKCTTVPGEGEEQTEAVEIGSVSFDDKTGIITWNIGDVEANKTYNVILEVTVNELPEGVYEKEISNEFILLRGEDRLTTNTITTTVKKAHLSITKQSENLKEINKVGDNVKFIINFENDGALTSAGQTIAMIIPNEIMGQEIKKGKEGETISGSVDSSNIVVAVPLLEPGEKYIFELSGIIDIDANYTAQYQSLEFVATVSETTEGLDGYDEPDEEPEVVEPMELRWPITIENPNYVDPTIPTATPTPTPDLGPEDEDLINNATPTPTPTPTPGGTNPGTTTPTPTPGGTNPGTPTPTPTPGGTNPGTATPTPTPGGTNPGTATPTPTPGGTNPGTTTPTPTPGGTNPGTKTPTPTPGGTKTPTPTPKGNKPSQDNDEETFTVSGIVWIDANKDGVMQADEKNLEGIVVKIANSNGVVKQAKTDKNGKYVFEKIAKGEYQIGFEYDSSKYGVTQYHKTGELEINSSAVTSMNGMAVTDVISIENDTRNINLGLIEKPVFDMALTKTVSKIIVQTSEGTEEYTYNNNFAKLDIKAKNLKGAVVVVEYKLTVKNEGDISGTVKSIVDYIPKGMTFSTDLNKNWIQGSDGNLYNSELKNLEIKPGETKEILLILTKTMTDNNVGLINNVAEIAEVENSENLKDTDSNPLNKSENEDDMSSADVLIGVRTGSEVLYTSLLVIALIMIAAGAYIIRKKI